METAEGQQAESKTQEEPGSMVKQQDAEPQKGEGVEAPRPSEDAAPTAIGGADHRVQLLSSLGMPARKRDNLQYVEDGMLLFASGNTVQLVDLLNGQERRVVTTPSGGGVGAVALHSSKKYIAVAVSGSSPRIYVYSYPQLAICKELKGGAEVAFSSVAFSHNGDLLASVSTGPDYLLTVWDWQKERVMLHTKAFSQEIFRVAFSPVDAGRLVTSGVGHIRFWKIASTFTGLKLQGATGKFGNVALSDISAFAELPSGKVVSGTEQGYLLLWDGSFIQLRVSAAGGEPCHRGAIEYLSLEADGTLVSAGADGYIRRWNFDGLEYADAGDDDNQYSMEPVSSFFVGEGVSVAGMLRGDDHWLVQSANGSLLRVHLPDLRVDPVMDFHAGPVTGCVLALDGVHAYSAGADGSVRAWNVNTRLQTHARFFSAPATTLLALPAAAGTIQRRAIAGFADGSVRLLGLDGPRTLLLGALRVHSAPVTALAVAPNGASAAVAAEDGTVFFVELDGADAPQLGRLGEPVGFVQLPEGARGRSLCWSDDSERLLVAGGRSLYEYVRPHLGDLPPASKRDSFVLALSPKILSVGLPEGAVMPLGVQVETAHATYSDGTGSVLVAFEGRTKTRAQQQQQQQQQSGASGASPEATTAGAASPRSDGETDSEARRASAEAAASARAARPQPPVRAAAFEALYEFGPAERDGAPQLRRSVGLGAQGALVSSLSVTSSLLGDGRCLKLLVLGLSNGVSQVRPLLADEGEQPRTIDMPGHLDEHAAGGGVLGVAVDIARGRALSGGSDGCLLLRAVRWPWDESAAAAAVPLAELAHPQPGGGEGQQQQQQQAEAEDLKPSGEGGIIYSLEEAKQKQERDEQLAAARRKKDAVRAEVQSLAAEFQRLLRLNEQLPEAERLPATAFEIDPELRRRLEEEAEARVNAVRREMAYESEKCTVALQKLRDRFLSSLITEHVTMRAFRQDIWVSSFRVAELPAWLQTEIEEIRRLAEQENRDESASSVGAVTVRAATAGSASAAPAAAGASVVVVAAAAAAAAAAGHNDPMSLSLHGKTPADETASSPSNRGRATDPEARRRAREERRKQREALAASRPNEHVDDPQDALMIREAAENMGDYKLKSDPDYIVPLDQRVNAEKKRRQMVMLLESVHSIKTSFNERFLALRSLKERIVSSVTSDSERLRQLNQWLGRTGDDAVLRVSLDPSEFPERRDEITEADITAFEAELRARAAKAESERRRAASGGFYDEGAEGADAAGYDKTVRPNSNSSAAASSVAAAATSAATRATGAQDGAAGGGGNSWEKFGAQSAALVVDAGDDREAGTEGAAGEMGGAAGPDAAAQAARAVRQRRLREWERQVLVEKMDQAVSTFDDAVSDLRQEKLRLDADLCMAELRLLTMYRELQLLKEFSSREEALTVRLTAAQRVKAQVVQDMSKCERDLAARLEEIQSWQERDRQVLQEFHSLVGGPKGEFFLPLLQIFRKRIKGSKKRRGAGAGGGGGGTGGAGGGGASDDDGSSNSDGRSDASDSSSEADDDHDHDDDDDDDDDDDESCPVGCESAVYEKVLELRRKRVEQEEVLAEFKAVVVELTKKFQQFQARERTIDKELQATETEIQHFQSEKQQALNQVEVTVPLRLGQIRFLDSQQRLPDDVGGALVFTSSGLQHLRERITQLSEDKQRLRVQLRDLRRQFKSQQKELEQKRQLIEQEKSKCEEVQMLKFGTVIDLSILEQVGSDEAAEELKQRLWQLESESLARAKEWERQLAAAQDELARVTQENTQRLARVAELTHAQYELEDELNRVTREIHASDKGLDEGAGLEARRLTDLVRSQEQEIETLKAEIHVLRRKGGHVYAPI